MKKIGVITLAIGALITILTNLNFTYASNEKILDVGHFQISQRKTHSLLWSPMAGVTMMVIGGAAYFFGIKRSLMR